MKTTLLTLCFMLSFGLSFSQSDSTETKPINVNYYIGLGLQSADDFNLSSALQNDEFPEIRTTDFEFSFGLTVQTPKSMYSLEWATSESEDDQNGYNYELSRNMIGLGYQYNLFKINQHKFNLGAQINYTFIENELYNTNSEADLANPSNLGELTKIDLNNWYLGPVMSFQFNNKDLEPWLRLQVSYDFNLSQNSWDSDYTQLINTIEEDQHMFRFQVILPF
ncbi:hypothetical protein SAMN05444278_10336 [Psychroflexus salarius]|uniref:Outer membrane protein beta-barrel domain-containing protein n=1 Tax=Psychroflexus salarius TaxID=1155689 RepID=A0A1M4UP30_9FLAO|nr:hypothetical protein [Psychroflexus salarius]SHE58476.1 hypothetical protein SAMN05444278_10336 [Psychroflexus salarius]